MCDRVQRLMALVPSVVETPHYLQLALPEWYHGSGKVILVGEAAHLINVSLT